MDVSALVHHGEVHIVNLTKLALSKTSLPLYSRFASAEHLTSMTKMRLWLSSFSQSRAYARITCLGRENVTPHRSSVSTMILYRSFDVSSGWHHNELSTERHHKKIIGGGLWHLPLMISFDLNLYDSAASLEKPSFSAMRGPLNSCMAWSVVWQLLVYNVSLSGIHDTPH